MTSEARPLVFLGTPDAAAIVLERLLQSNFNIAHVITRQDARRGRGGAMSPSPVKKIASEYGLSVSHNLDWINDNSATPHLGIVVAYGRLIPASVLAHTPMINVHFSLLPRWRGAAPVERAILAGDEKTGVCIMDLEETLDTGPVHCCRETPILPTHTSASLTSALAELGAQLLVDLLRTGLSHPTPQHGEATYAAKINSSELQINWRTSAQDIDRKVRALRSYSMVDDVRVRVLGTRVVENSSETHSSVVPGACNSNGVVVTGQGMIQLLQVQPEGKNPMNALDWLRGRYPQGLQFDQPAPSE